MPIRIGKFVFGPAGQDPVLLEQQVRRAELENEMLQRDIRSREQAEQFLRELSREGFTRVTEPGPTRTIENIPSAPAIERPPQMSQVLEDLEALARARGIQRPARVAPPSDEIGLGTAQFQAPDVTRRATPTEVMDKLMPLAGMMDPRAFSQLLGAVTGPAEVEARLAHAAAAAKQATPWQMDRDPETGEVSVFNKATGERKVIRTTEDALDAIERISGAKEKGKFVPGTEFQEPGYFDPQTRTFTPVEGARPTGGGGLTRRYTKDVLETIHDTGWDPVTGEDAAPEMKERAFASIRERQSRRMEQIRAEARARGEENLALEDRKFPDKEDRWVDIRELADPNSPVANITNKTIGELRRDPTYLRTDVLTFRQVKAFEAAGGFIDELDRVAKMLPRKGGLQTVVNRLKNPVQRFFGMEGLGPEIGALQAFNIVFGRILQGAASQLSDRDREVAALLNLSDGDSQETAAIKIGIFRRLARNMRLGLLGVSREQLTERQPDGRMALKSATTDKDLALMYGMQGVKFE